MITVIEVTTYEDGKQEVHEQDFSSFLSFCKELAKSAVDGRVVYELKKHKKAFIDFDEGVTVQIRVIDKDAYNKKA